jgi:hypothetical protein
MAAVYQAVSDFDHHSQHRLMKSVGNAVKCTFLLRETNERLTVASTQAMQRVKATTRYSVIPSNPTICRLILRCA